MKHLAPKGTYLFDFWTDVLYPSVVENETDTTARGYALGGLIFMLFNATEASLAHNLPRDDEIEALRQHCMDSHISTKEKQSMAYIVPKQLKPYNCSYCGTVFTAMTVPNQVATLTPCPYCQENRGNGRADKRYIEVSRESFHEFLIPPPASIKSAWTHLIKCYHAFNEKYADDDEASFFSRNTDIQAMMSASSSHTKSATNSG